MPRSGPRQVYKYTKALKLAAVRLSHTPGMQVKAVATAL
jgi:transposase-like protein